MKPTGMFARLIAAALFLALLGAWELIVRQAGVSALGLPAPSGVAPSCWAGPASGYFWPRLRATLATLLLGLAGGSVAGLLMGMALAESAWLDRILKPYVIVSQVIPKLALAPLF